MILLRIQRKRTSGWKMPANTKCVTRPGKWGNPFTAAGCREAGYIGTPREIMQRCADAFDAYLGPRWRENWDGLKSEEYRRRLLATLPELKGCNLACYCPLCPAHAEGKPFGVVCLDCSPCHSDVLGKIANGIEVPK